MRRGCPLRSREKTSPYTKSVDNEWNTHKMDTRKNKNGDKDKRRSKRDDHQRRASVKRNMFSWSTLGSRFLYDGHAWAWDVYADDYWGWRYRLGRRLFVTKVRKWRSYLSKRRSRLSSWRSDCGSPQLDEEGLGWSCSWTFFFHFRRWCKGRKLAEHMDSCNLRKSCYSQWLDESNVPLIALKTNTINVEISESFINCRKIQKTKGPTSVLISFAND